MANDMTTSSYGTTPVSIVLNNDNEDRAQASAQIVINGQIDQSITLTQNHFNFTLAETANAADLVFTLITPLPSGIKLNVTTMPGDVSSFSYQDVLDGLVVLTITDPDAIADLELALNDGQNPSITVAVKIITPSEDTNTQRLESETPQSSEADAPQEAASVQADNAPLSSSQDQGAQGQNNDDDVLPPLPTAVHSSQNNNVVLDEDTTEEVVYQIDSGNDYAARDGQTQINDFKLGQDILSFTTVVEDNNLTSITDLLAKASGDSSTFEDDQFLVKVNLGRDNADNTVITGLTFFFREGWVDDNGVAAPSGLTINFETPMTASDFLDKIGGIESFDIPNLLIKDLTVLPTLLGGAEHLKFLVKGAAPDFSTSDQDGLSVSAFIDAVWINSNHSVYTGESTNDASINDTVIYTDATQVNILAVLEDYVYDANDFSSDYAFIGETNVTLTIV